MTRLRQHKALRQKRPADAPTATTREADGGSSPMTAHVIDIETYNHMPEDGPRVTALTYQWVCSCGKRGPLYVTDVRRARNGGVRHQRAMDR